jgi:MFS family permease
MDAAAERSQQGRHDRSAAHRDVGNLIEIDAAVEPPTTETTGGREWRLLLPVMTVVFLAALDLTVVAPILPSVIDDLGVSAVDADRYAWIVLSYLVAYTVTVPLTGRISDFAGRIPVFIVALLLFLAGSVVVATAGGLATMVAGRAMQGLGGGAMLPVSMALVADVVPLRRRAATLGIVAAVDTFGWVLGPVWGAAIQSLFDSWRAIFWLNLPLGALVLVALVVARPAATGRRDGPRPSMLAAAAGTVSLVAFCLALSSGGEGGLGAGQGAGQLGGSTNPLAEYRWLLLGLALLACVAFVALERRSAMPIVPRALIRQRLFQLAGLANILVGTALIVAMVNAPLVVALLADADDVSTDTALILGSFTLAMTVGAVVGGRFVHRVDARAVAFLGLVVGAAGFASMSWWPDELRLGLMAATMAVTGLGLGIVIAPIGETAVRAARVDEYGAASGLVLLARLLGMTVGLSAITAYGLERLDTRVAELPDISPLPGETTSDFFQRQEEFLNEQVIPLTLDVIGETFLVAALICLVAAVVVTRMRARVSRDE